MPKNWIYHDSHDLSYRNPFGAVACNTFVTLRLCVNAHDKLDEVIIFLYNKTLGEHMINMDLAQAHENRFIYEAEFTTAEYYGLIRYYFILKKHEKTFFYGNNSRQLGGVGQIYSNPPPSYQITVFKEGTSTPNWLKEGIMYQIFVDRFYNGCEDKVILNPKPGSLIHAHWDNNPVYIRDLEKGDVVRWDFFGGNLLGILKKLSYFKELGVNILYLNPIFESPSNHKYDTADYKKIDAMFGDNSFFIQLAAIAKKMGIKIILDGVFSHTGSDSIYFNKEGSYPSLGAYQSKESPYYSWYRFDEFPDTYDSWWGVDSLPNVNELEPTYRKFIIDDEDSVSKLWIKLGSKGWRLDVADEIPGEFLKHLRKAVKEADPQAILIGEVWEDASNKVSYGEEREYLFGDELDSVTNYPFRKIFIDFFLGNNDAWDVHFQLMSLYENYPLEHFYSTMNLIGSHDVARVLTLVSEMPAEDTLTQKEKVKIQITPEQMRFGIARVKALALVQMTFPGCPCIYYGDEAGLTGYADPLCRKTYPWGNENKELLNWYKKVVALRNSYDSLKTGSWDSFVVNKDIYGYVRSISKEKDVFSQKRKDSTILILFNKNKHKQAEISLDVQRWKGNMAIDLLSDEKKVNLNQGLLSIAIKPTEGRVIRLN